MCLFVRIDERTGINVKFWCHTVFRYNFKYSSRPKVFEQTEFFLKISYYHTIIITLMISSHVTSIYLNEPLVAIPVVQILMAG